MNTCRRAWLAAAMVLFGLGQFSSDARAATQELAGLFGNAPSGHADSPGTATTVQPRLFSSTEVHAFLAAARQAESIKDPMQRCLAYPNPPGSHWSREAVKAYCQYNLQPVLSFDEMKAMIDAGHAAALDRRLARDLRDQFTKPAARGRLDHTFFADFNNGSPEMRATLDAWKRASPASAFAYAASGFAYVDRAFQVRGGDFIQRTPQAQLDEMNRLFSLADADLQRALALNPKITPAYVAMIHAGLASLGQDYLLSAAKRGLAIAPDDYAIYGMLSGAEEPRWGGSLEGMQQVADAAMAHAKQNPLLTIMLSTVPAYKYGVCNCKPATEWSQMPVMFDNMPSTDLLLYAGHAANEHGHIELAVVYLSEALRFRPNSYARLRRNYALSNYDEPGWAFEDANRLISEQPQCSCGYSMRGYAYEDMKQYDRAEADFIKAERLNPKDTWPLAQQGKMFVYEAKDWDKGWAVADRLIQTHPELADGWVLRANIQGHQPRAGLADTVHYFKMHFGGDQAERVHLSQLESMLAQQASAKNPVNPAVDPAHR